MKLILINLSMFIQKKKTFIATFSPSFMIASTTIPKAPYPTIFSKWYY